MPRADALGRLAVVAGWNNGPGRLHRCAHGLQRQPRRSHGRFDISEWVGHLDWSRVVAELRIWNRWRERLGSESRGTPGRWTFFDGGRLGADEQRHPLGWVELLDARRRRSDQ